MNRLAQSEADHALALVLLWAELAHLADVAPESFGVDWEGIIDSLVTLDSRGILTEAMLASMERRAVKQRGEG